MPYDSENENEVLVFEEELKLLRKIAETSRALVFARDIPELARESRRLRVEHTDAVRCLLAWCEDVHDF